MSMHTTASQNPGTALASCMSVRDTTSTTPPGRMALATPSTHDTASATAVAYTASSSVTGSVCAMTCHTGAPYVREVPQSPVSTPHIQETYCSGRERSRPIDSRSCCRACGVASVPSTSVAVSPGTTCSAANVSSDTTKSTASAAPHLPASVLAMLASHTVSQPRTIACEGPVRPAHASPRTTRGSC